MLRRDIDPLVWRIRNSKPYSPVQGWFIGMNKLLLWLARGAQAVWLVTALAVCVSTASAQPLPVPAPRTPVAVAPDPIGALLARQGLGNGPRALPMVIGLNI